MKIKKFFCLTLISAIYALSIPAHAQSNIDSSPSSMQQAYQHAMKPYQEGSWDLYLTGHIWHMGNTFKGKDLNADAYGGGLGKHWTDENGHQDLLYGFVFLDSHKDPEPIIGYARQWFFQPFSSSSLLSSVSLGAGFTAGFTARADIAHYVPIPLVLPVGSIRLNKFSLMGTLVPRRQGAVALLWGRYEF